MPIFDFNTFSAVLLNIAVYVALGFLLFKILRRNKKSAR